MTYFKIWFVLLIAAISWTLQHKTKLTLYLIDQLDDTWGHTLCLRQYPFRQSPTWKDGMVSILWTWMTYAEMYLAIYESTVSQVGPHLDHNTTLLLWKHIWLELLVAVFNSEQYSENPLLFSKWCYVFMEFEVRIIRKLLWFRSFIEINHASTRQNK